MCSRYVVVQQATDEIFYHDVVLFPVYLDYPVSLIKPSMIVYGTLITLVILGMSACIPMLISITLVLFDT